VPRGGRFDSQCWPALVAYNILSSEQFLLERMLKLVVYHINYYLLDLKLNIYCSLPVRIITLKNNLISVVRYGTV
jgi:hypothetical protein